MQGFDPFPPFVIEVLFLKNKEHDLQGAEPRIFTKTTVSPIYSQVFLPLIYNMNKPFPLVYFPRVDSARMHLLSNA